MEDIKLVTGAKGVSFTDLRRMKCVKEIRAKDLSSPIAPILFTEGLCTFDSIIYI